MLDLHHLNFLLRLAFFLRKKGQCQVLYQFFLNREKFKEFFAKVKFLRLESGIFDLELFYFKYNKKKIKKLTQQNQKIVLFI